MANVSSKPNTNPIIDLALLQKHLKDSLIVEDDEFDQRCQQSMTSIIAHISLYFNFADSHLSEAKEIKLQKTKAKLCGLADKLSCELDAVSEHLRKELELAAWLSKRAIAPPIDEYNLKEVSDFLKRCSSVWSPTHRPASRPPNWQAFNLIEALVLKWIFITRREPSASEKEVTPKSLFSFIQFVIRGVNVVGADRGVKPITDKQVSNLIAKAIKQYRKRKAPK